MNPSLPSASSSWQLQDAKAHFSAVVRQAEVCGPQYISVRGRPAVVVLSQKDFQRLQANSDKPGFTELMRASPLVGLSLPTNRSTTLTRHNGPMLDWW